MTSKTENKTKHPRYIGQIHKSWDLPTIVLLAGIHGNESTGIKAINEVFQTIDRKNIHANGNIIGIRGNLGAIEKNERYIDADLNRAWTLEKISEFLSHDSPIYEAQELRELKQELDSIVSKTQAPIYMIDFHTTSSHSPPFVIFDDSIRNRKLSDALPVTSVLGVLEKLKGTVLSYYGELGPSTMVFEAGKHEDRQSYINSVAAIWLTLIHLGIIDKEAVPDWKLHNQILLDAAKGSPNVVETVSRFPLKSNDIFVMEPGYRNFESIKKGEWVATLNSEPVKAPKGGFIFMPLYQKKGEDGFFVVRKISKFWTKMSRIFRSKFFNSIHAFPGVSRNEYKPGTFVVNKKIARLYPVNIFHLFGFRIIEQDHNKMLVSRRPFDLKGPWDNYKKKK